MAIKKHPSAKPRKPMAAMASRSSRKLKPLAKVGKLARLNKPASLGAAAAPVADEMLLGAARKLYADIAALVEAFARRLHSHGKDHR